MQAQVLPDLAGKLDAMMSQMAEQNRLLGEQLLADQRFHEEAKVLYTNLAQSVDASLKTSLRESATATAEAIQPIVATTMASIAGETRNLHDKLFGSVETQLSGVAAQFTQTAASIGETWSQALARHEQATDTQHLTLQTTIASYADTLEQRSTALLDSLEANQTRLQADAAQQLAALTATTATRQQQQASTLAEQVTGLTTHLDRTVTQIADTFGEHSQSLLASIDASHAAFAETTRAQQNTLTQHFATQLDSIAQRFDGAMQTVAETWTSALTKHEQASDRLTQTLDRTQTSLAETFAERSAALLADQRTAQSAWQSEWSAGEEARQTRFTEALGAMASTLETQWQQASDRTLAQQEAITQTLNTTARDLVAATQSQAEMTIAEVTRLMQTAAEAPKAAAEVISELRHELSASMAHDNSLLEERSRIMDTLGTLLDAINHASTEQRSAIDALVATSAELLERVGGQFTAKVESEAGKLIEIGASVAGGALEVASLGEAFGHAVQLFSDSNEKMMAALQRIESGLAKSLTRSDEQLAYYVAQAREVIELSILSQKKMVDDLQRAGRSEA